MAQYQLVWKSGFVTGFLGVPWICVVSFVLTFLNPVTIGQDVPEFGSVGFLLEPNDVIAVSGSPVTLNCSVQPTDIVPVIRWTQGTSQVENDQTRTIMPNGALRIASVSAFDEGSYRCTAELEDADYFSKVGTLSIARLQLQEGPEDIVAYTGDTIFFRCDFDSIPSPQISWLKNGLVLDLTEERISARYTLLPSGGLEIREVRSSDGGTYRCQGTNRLFSTPLFSNNALLTINPGANPGFQFIKIPNQEIQAPVGETVVIEVATDSPATFTWFKDDEEIFIVGSDEHYSLVGQGSLRIKQVGEIDTGLYRVLATSQSDDTNTLDHVVKVTALVPLKFNIMPQNTYINVGDDVTLECNVYGIPGPTIAWYKYGEALEPGDFYVFSPTGSLTIKNVITEDAGIYQCVADNGLENLQALAQLIVLREGIAIPTRPPEPSTVITAAPVPQITTTSPPDQPDLGPVPSEPRFVIASDVQARSFTLTWREPAQLNGNLDNYRIYLKWDGGSKIETAYDLRTFLSDLAPETRYEVTIYAINENGDGVASETLIVETLPPGDYLGPPVNIHARAGEVSCTALLLTWEPPQDGETDSYVVYYADLSGGVAQELQLYTEQQFYLITDLKAYTKYGLRVVASNGKNGPGASSRNLEARTSQCKPSGVPANLTVEADSASSIRVTWNQPIFIERNGLITGYKLKYRTVDNGKRTHSVVINGDSRSFTIQDLYRDTAYEVRMAASNANGTGPYSDWVHMVTFKEDKNGSAPSMPMGLRVVVTSPYSAVASWVDQDYIGQSIPEGRNYTVRYRTNYPSNKFMYINSSDLSVVIDNLNPYTEYQFEVRAFDGGEGGGHSSYGLVTTNKTFEAAPGSPVRSLTVVHVENSSTALGLNWQPPKNPNGQITGYTIFYSTTNSNVAADWVMDYITGEDLTKTIHQLTSDTMYYFKIQSHTSKGEGPISDVVSATTPTAIIVPPVPVNPVPSAGPPLAAAGAMGFPWWLWLLIILAILFIIILAVLLLLCFMCGCCGCCASCCPCCAAFCDDLCGCCAPICGPIAACFAACCPCCCEDEDGCARCWLKFCCGASACVCCGQAYRERKKAKGSANLTGYHAVSQNGKAVGSTPAPPDLWINHEGVEMKVDGKKTAMTLSPINAKSSEREMLNQGKGVDQQRESTQETSFTQSAVQNQQESQIHVSSEDQRQSQYETPTLISAASHRSSLDSDLHVRGMGNGTVHYATVDEMHTARKKSNERQSGRHEAAGRTSPRYASWGAKANLNDQQKSSVNYNTTNIHVEDTRNNYTANDGFTTLRGNGHQGNSGEAYSTLDRQASQNNAYSPDNQIITFPETAGGPQPFTITFEETTTSHNVEKSVPLPDGTNYKTSSSHQTFAKSYSTSDASQDQNLQAMLQGGLENGPLAIEIPSSTNNTLPAITAAPMFRSGSFNPIPQDSPSSIASHPIGRSPPPPNYNFTSSENNSAQTQSSGYTSNLSGNTRGRASSIGASSIDSTGYRGRRGSENYNSEYKSSMQGTSPINIPPPSSSSAFPSSFQNYDSYRMEESDKRYGLGRSASDLYTGSSSIGLTKPRAGFNTIDRSAGFSTDSAYGSPTHGNGFTLPARTGGLSVPEYRAGNSYQSSAFQNTSESNSYGSYGNGLRSGGQSQFSYNNNNASIPTKPAEVDHADVQAPEKFSSQSSLLQSTSYTSPSIPAFTARPLRRSMSVDHEFGLENNDSYWNGGSNTNLQSSYHRETKESSASTRGFDSDAAELQQRGRSRFVGDKTYGGISSRSRSLDRFGEREERHMSPVGGYDYHASSPRQHQMDRPAYMYNTNTTSSGYHSDTNTTSSHDDGSSTQGSTSRAGNPLSSFSVPGPPPNYQAARVKIQAPSYSPLKRNTQPGVARVRAQPLPVVTPRAPDVTYRGVGDGTSPGVSLYQESTNRSFSTEDLNTEMLNLEGLMKDLNAITASELQS